MSEKKSVYEKIADELGVELHETEIQKHEPTEIVQSTEHADQDYRAVRGNLYDIISKGNDAIDGGSSDRIKALGQLCGIVGAPSFFLKMLHPRVNSLVKVGASNLDGQARSGGGVGPSGGFGHGRRELSLHRVL